MDLSQLIAGYSSGGRAAGGGGGGSSAASTAALAAAGPYGAAIGAVAGALSTPTSSGVSGDESNRFFQNAGAGWTVATGRAAAHGAPITTPSEAAYGAGAAPALAGVSPVLMLAMAAIFAAMVLRKVG